jgi:hypothetical protein
VLRFFLTFYLSIFIIFPLLCVSFCLPFLSYFFLISFFLLRCGHNWPTHTKNTCAHPCARPLSHTHALARTHTRICRCLKLKCGTKTWSEKMRWLVWLTFRKSLTLNIPVSWHSFTWLIHAITHSCCTTHSHNSFTWLIHVTHSHKSATLNIPVSWRILECHMTHLNIRVSWL